ncbi:MAG: hypothetical protein JWP34_3451, partial [Massilia sp.]|nr:hypothetical protein [Massilia sp.]
HVSRKRVDQGPNTKVINNIVYKNPASGIKQY